jgi:hypothetical protein
VSDAEETELLRGLITEAVDSFEKLEVLVYIVKAGNAIAPAPEIAKALGMSVDDVDQSVKSLRSAGVFDTSGPWAPAVTILLQMYETDRIRVLELMTKMALDRVRKQAARVFADAFVIKPAKKKGDNDA